MEINRFARQSLNLISAKVTDALGAVTAFSYDAEDRKFVVTDPVNRQTEFV